MKPEKSVIGFYFWEQSMNNSIQAEKVKPFSLKLNVSVRFLDI